MRRHCPCLTCYQDFLGSYDAYDQPLHRPFDRHGGGGDYQEVWRRWHLRSVFIEKIISLNSMKGKEVSE